MKLNKIMLDMFYKNNAEARGTPVIQSDNELVRKHKYRLSDKTLSEVDAEYWSYILELLNTASEYTQEEKNLIVEQTVEYYSIQTGYQIKNGMLVALADFILDTVLSNKSPDKVSREEHPILSYKQLYIRRRRELSIQDAEMDYLTSQIAKKKYTSEFSENK